MAREVSFPFFMFICGYKLLAYTNLAAGVCEIPMLAYTNLAAGVCEIPMLAYTKSPEKAKASLF